MVEYRAMQKSGYRALAVMEQQLDRTPFLVGDNFSIADIALYAYTHVAHQGGFDGALHRHPPLAGAGSGSARLHWHAGLIRSS